VNNRAATNEILSAALAAFHQIAGVSARVMRPPRSAADPVADALVKITTARGDAQFVAEIKAVDRFRTPAQVKSQLRHYTELPLLVAPFVSRETAELCRSLRLNFIDTAGNAYVEAPGLYIYVTGQPRPTHTKVPRLRASGTAGLRVTFSLLSRPDLVRAPYREIAKAAATSLGTITPVMEDLKARAFLGGGRIRTILDPRRLLEEWVTHYPISLRPTLLPMMFEAPPEDLLQADLKSLRAFWSGEVAANRLTQFLKPARFTIYTHQPPGRLVAALRLRGNPAGNVEVLKAFWNLEPDPTHPDLVPSVLTYADLLATRDGRNIEAANLIYEQRIEPAFRALNTTR
jgi:hypothetical protein